MTTAGWYPDPEGVLRWWDGQQWTEHVQPGTLPPAGPPGATGSMPPAGATHPNAPATVPGHGSHAVGEPPRRRRGLLAALVALALVVVGALVVGALLLSQDDDDPAPSASEPSATSSPSPSESAPESSSPSEAPSEPTPTPSPSSPAPVEPGPEEVADEFMAAVVALDCPAAEALSTRDFLRRSGGCADEGVDREALAGATYELQEPVVDAGRATVDVVLQLSGTGGNPFTFALTLVETSRGWRVDDLAEQA